MCIVRYAIDLTPKSFCVNIHTHYKQGQVMQVTAAQVQYKTRADYKLWDGEMLVTVFQHQGAHGFYSALMVIEYPDSPLETRLWDGYRVEYEGDTRIMPTLNHMRTWIAEQLTALAIGAVPCNVEGLMS